MDIASKIPDKLSFFLLNNVFNTNILLQFANCHEFNLNLVKVFFKGEGPSRNRPFIFHPRLELKIWFYPRSQNHTKARLKFSNAYNFLIFHPIEVYVFVTYFLVG